MGGGEGICHSTGQNLIDSVLSVYLYVTLGNQTQVARLHGR